MMYESLVLLNERVIDFLDRMPCILIALRKNIVRDRGKESEVSDVVEQEMQKSFANMARLIV